ncbi:MAG: flagellar biosynthetic protein FliO [Telmatospirillum sp.]|nr:flagellar biosynthetic protein FliO [Telmatospirillum sp.]
MDWDLYFRAVLALGVVLALIAAAAWVARRYGLGGALALGRKARRLALVEVLPLDNRRRLVLVRKDGVEHLLLIGGASDLVVEKGWSSSDEDLDAAVEEKDKDR